MPTRQIILMIVLLGVSLYAVYTWTSGSSYYNVEIRSESRIVVEGRETTPDALIASVRDDLADGKSVTVDLEADEALPAGVVVDLVQQLQDAGVQQINVEAATPP